MSDLISCEEPKFSPYIDITLDGPSLLQYKQQLGVRAFSLAFAIGGTGGCSPMWGGQIAIDNPKIINQIREFRAAGGDVIVSTGGALGPYLESSCGSAGALANAYKRVLSVTGSTHLDIDIESSIPVDAMNQALASLQRENPSITVSYTMMVQGDDYGITNELGVNVLKSAVRNGVNVDIVNPMTMDFGSSKAWGDAVISASEATVRQMKEVWPQKSEQELYSMLGVTPMLGRNDNGALFDQNHARQLVNWAKQKGVGHLAFWSIGRDKGCPGQRVGPTCSSIAQSDYEFTKIFLAFDDGKPLPTGQPITQPPVTQRPVTDPPVTQPHQRTTRRGDQPVDCSVEDSRYPDPNDCNKFYHCYGGVAHEERCGSGTIWNTEKGLCDYPQNANRPECHCGSREVSGGHSGSPNEPICLFNNKSFLSFDSNIK